MKERYGDMMLYYALCPESALTERGLDVAMEGRFNFDPATSNDRLRDWYFTAMRIVKTHLSQRRITIGYSDGIADKESDASKLIAYAEANIPGSRPVIRLIECMHGDIMFDKVIRFDGYTQDQRDELIETMKRSGYQPENWRKSDLRTSDVDKLWNDALRFY